MAVEKKAITKQTVQAPLASVVVSIAVKDQQVVARGDTLFLLEAMKMQHPVIANTAGIVCKIQCSEGDTVLQGASLCELQMHADARIAATPVDADRDTRKRADFAAFKERQQKSLDAARTTAIEKRHSKAYRSARENLADLCDEGSFVEYGQFAVAAQRSRRSADDLIENTAADGVITGTASINGMRYEKSATRGNDNIDDGHVAASAKVAVIINDYTVLAGTQGHFHHRKLDRILELALAQRLPTVMYTEGGGGRPGDTDQTTIIAGLNIHSFASWARLAGVAPRIAINNGYCFAGNAALFGCADITIATKNSWIGMAGPAMIEGGGLGVFKPQDIGPIDVQAANGVVDIVADDEAHATALAKKVLGYFQGAETDGKAWRCLPQEALRELVPEDRNRVYDVGTIISTLADVDSVVELRRGFGVGVVVALLRIEGRPMGLLANDCRELGGAIDAEAADKAANFIKLCDQFGLPLLSLCDTPGFMVGPDSETQAAVRRMANLFTAGANISVPLISIFLRKGYGLGAMAMTGGSFAAPVYCAAWPSGEFGAMGLEAAVRLGYKKELAAETDTEKRQQLFDDLVAQSYEVGRANEAASFLEIDAVIDPADTRRVIVNALLDN